MHDEKTISVIGHANPTESGFTISLDPRYADGLTGLSDFSHAVVLWWASESDSVDQRSQLVYQKPYTHNPDDVGVFSSRSPSRPNPIGLSVIALQHVDTKKATITTPYIDTEPGTPIIDIKPYFPASDRVRDAKMPTWCNHWPACYEESASFDWASEFE